MKITRTLDTKSATYDIIGISDEDFNMLCRSYERYMYEMRHCPPADDDILWQKMNQLQKDRITIV